MYRTKEHFEKIRQRHLDAFQWKAEQPSLGIWVADKSKQTPIDFETSDFDSLFFQRQMTILEDTMKVPSDLLPVLGITNYGIAAVPSLFRAPMRASSTDVDLVEETGYWIQPVIQTHKDLDALEKLDFDSEMYQSIVRHMLYYREHKPDGVQISNSLDGPFSIAALLRGSDIYFDVTEDPQFVHAILSLCTEAIIRCEKSLREVLGYSPTVDGSFPTYFGICAPGLRFGDDSIINLSQDMLAEFVLPYYERISESFGCPLLIHFCSVNRPIGKQIANALKDSDSIVGISSQLGFELYEELESELRGKLAIECGYGNGIPYAVQKYGGFRQFARHIKSKKDSGMVLYTTAGSVEEAEKLWETWCNA